MNRSTKLKLAILHFGVAAVCFAAGYAQGTHDMMAVVNAFIK